MPTVLITGANRGLGLEFCRQYADAEWRVLGCCRDPETADELHDLARRQQGVSVHRLDLGRREQIDRLARELSSESIDVLINNAGIYGDSAENRFGSVDYDLWAKVFWTNVEAPVRMLEAFLPHLQRGSRRLAVAITSLMGSIADNGSGGSLMYRSTKAALNAAMKTLAIDLQPQGVSTLLLHPGWVQTDMGGRNAPTTPQESIAGMRAVIEGFKPEDSGCFIDFRGRELPW